MTELNASIITIGDELLIGQTIDTNSAFIAQELNKIGVWVQRRVAIADDKNAILKTLAAEALQSNIIIITGGLGPTADDITKPALCEYFQSELVTDTAVLENVTAIFKRFGRPVTERNAAQALVPHNCTVLPNLRGTAPGMWFGPHPFDAKQESDIGPSIDGNRNEQAGTIYVSLPGVPHEMKGLMLDVVIPKIKTAFVLPAVVHKTLLTAGQGESVIADLLHAFENNLPPAIKLAYLPAHGMVRLRLTGKSQYQNEIESQVADKFEVLKQLVAEWLVADEDISLPQAVSQLMIEKQLTIGTAESCTGGNIARMLTAVAGSSGFFKGSVVAYDNEVKINLLQVQQTTLIAHGAVSEQTVTEMAVGACKILQSDYALATSGIMGPGGGSNQKPVGTVWLAVAHTSGKVKSRQLQLHFDRGRNIEIASFNALNMLRLFVLQNG